MDAKAGWMQDNSIFHCETIWLKIGIFKTPEDITVLITHITVFIFTNDITMHKVRSLGVYYLSVLGSMGQKI